MRLRERGALELNIYIYILRNLRQREQSSQIGFESSRSDFKRETEIEILIKMKSVSSGF